MTIHHVHSLAEPSRAILIGLVWVLLVTFWVGVAAGLGLARRLRT